MTFPPHSTGNHSQRPHTQRPRSQNDTAPTNQNNIATRSRRKDQQQHRRKITATLAATIPKTSPAASLDDLKTLLDNAAEIG
jgi:hypothetical protein